ncbi:aminoglycoside phosphotransferase family protein [Streptomyces arenae]|uniref:aminoglycoside phosphotransferase family protein n=1 Tax=Streptomyces arenae TaxID=29301 RepID=UPI00265A7286|nr:aminoglycoside phosphotransferase family protein [Streptomyces arenae]MCG7208331.1 aminoglycoside phosphotransferase family protein [Streptomyces arenae]
MHDTADLIAERYGLGPGPWTLTPVTRGALGRIWKLTNAAGAAWAAKQLLFGCDEDSVAREAGLRLAAERLGIDSPRLFADRRGAHVTRVPVADGVAHVKLYDWIEGTRADPRDPVVLDWFGRTMGLLHRAGAGATEAPHEWYERCPAEADWWDLHARVTEAGLPWADALGRFIGTSAVELARWVSPSDAGDRVISHLDLQPQNVLAGPAGPVLLDWDNAGPVSAEREFAQALYVWSGGNRADPAAARRLTRAYRRAGGPATVRGPESFALLFATALNYVHVQAEAAVDPELPPDQREFGSGEVAARLADVPDLAAVSRLIAAVTP